MDKRTKAEWTAKADAWIREAAARHVEETGHAVKVGVGWVCESCDPDLWESFETSETQGSE